MRRLVRSALAGGALVAVLAGCTMPTAATPTPEASNDGASSALLTQVERLEVVGDSISLGVNACEADGPCPELSWATGTDPAVASVATRLHALAPEAALDVSNRSREGARIADALAAVDTVVADEPDLVLVLIGANDACAPDVGSVTSAADFDRSATRLASELGTGLPQATILMLSVPDLNRLWEVNRANETAVARWSASPACRSLLAGARSDAPEDDERRAMIAARVDEYNASIERACAAVPNCVDDGGAVHRIAFDTGDVSSLDYFHPSASAQARIAQIAWEALSEAG